MPRVLCAALLLTTGCHSDLPPAVRSTTPLATPPQAQRSTTPAAAPPPTLPTLIDKPGLYVVGRDIQAGAWHTDGPAAPPDPCWWQVVSPGDPNASAPKPVPSTGPVDLTLNVANTQLQTWFCQPWHRVQ